MNPHDAKMNVPFTVTECGSIRIADSRVSLETVVYEYQLGATPEQIVDFYPSLSLSDVHLVIAYYLTHREEIEAYIIEQERECVKFFHKLESDPKQQQWRQELRRRVLSRKAQCDAS